MNFFSMSLFKKTLEKKFLYPTAVFLLIIFELVFVTDGILEPTTLGKKSLSFALSIPFFSCCLLIAKIGMKNKNEFNFKEATSILLNEGPKIAFATLISSSFFLGLMLSGCLVHSFEKLPVAGPYLKIVLCVANFFILLVENLSILATFLLFYVLASLTFTKRNIDLKMIVLELQELFSKNSTKMMSFIKASLPLFLLGSLCMITKNNVIESDQGAFKLLYEMILAIPISLVLAPFVNYFFLAVQVLEEKSMMKDLRITQSSLAR